MTIPDPVFPITRKDKKRGLPHRDAVKYVRRMHGDKFVRWANRISRYYGQGVTFAYNQQTDRYRATDEFGTHSFAYPARLWTVWEGLAHRAETLGAEYLIDQLPLQDDDTIVDIGANTGDLLLHFQWRKIRPNVICFEPAPKEYGTLCENLASSKSIADYKSHQLALWSETTEGMTFYLDGDNADSSLVEIGKATETITVPTRRLDEVIDRRPYKLLKLEAEGAEPEILAGAEGVLDCFEYITADVGFERGVRAASTLPEVVNHLSQVGFEVVGFHGNRFTLLFRRKNIDAT